VRSSAEPVLQITCRDRNRIALQAELLGAAALGIRNILALRGDDPTLGDQPDTKPVFDLDTTALLATAQQMRSEHRLPTGTEIKCAVRFVLGTAELPVDPAPDWRPNGLLSKMEAGAEFIQTQFCMDPDAVRRYAARLLDLGVAQRLPILIGVAPIPSARSARWMKERLFGAMIPDALVERLERAVDPKAEGRRICVAVLPFMEKLAERFDVLVPEHPGFGASDEPGWLENMHDLAYFYLDVLESLELRGVHLVGSSLGGWLALEMAVRDASRLKSLVLVGPAGISVPGVSPGDVFLWSPEELARNLFFDPALAEKMLAQPVTPELLDVSLK